MDWISVVVLYYHRSCWNWFICLFSGTTSWNCAKVLKHWRPHAAGFSPFPTLNSAPLKRSCQHRLPWSGACDPREIWSHGRWRSISCMTATVWRDAESAGIGWTSICGFCGSVQSKQKLIESYGFLDKGAVGALGSKTWEQEPSDKQLKIKVCIHIYIYNTYTFTYICINNSIFCIEKWDVLLWSMTGQVQVTMTEALGSWVACEWCESPRTPPCSAKAGLQRHTLLFWATSCHKPNT